PDELPAPSLGWRPQHRHAVGLRQLEPDQRVRRALGEIELVEPSDRVHAALESVVRRGGLNGTEDRLNVAVGIEGNGPIALSARTQRWQWLDAGRQLDGAGSLLIAGGHGYPVRTRIDDVAQVNAAGIFVPRRGFRAGNGHGVGAVAA